MGFHYIYINMGIRFVCLAASAFNVFIACPRHRYYGITCRGIHFFFFCWFGHSTIFQQFTFVDVTDSAAAIPFMLYLGLITYFPLSRLPPPTPAPPHPLPPLNYKLFMRNNCIYLFSRKLSIGCHSCKIVKITWQWQILYISEVLRKILNRGFRLQ